MSRTGSFVKGDLSNAIASAKSEKFSSRWAFWLAAIGCAVGFGNVWRFPYLCYQHGGFAFLVPYVLTVFLIAVPISIMEMALGQISQAGCMVAWSKLGRRSRTGGMVGWVSMLIATYYPLLLVWTMVYFFNCFRSPMPWVMAENAAEICKALETSQEDCTAQVLCEWNPSSQRCLPDLIHAAGEFFRDSCYVWDRLDQNEHHLGVVGISTTNVLFLFLCWSLSCVAIMGGAKILGYIMYVTMTLPTIFLIILCVVGATLPGSGKGLLVYLAKFDVSKLNSTALVDAISQAVFSLGIGQGTLTSFASHNMPGNNIVQDTLVICGADTLFALMAGFSVFAVIGHLSHTSGIPISDLRGISGVGLAFMTYPVGLSSISGVGANILTAIFFLTLWLLGMDTLVAFTEAIILICTQSRLGKSIGLKRWHAAAAFSIFLFLFPGLLLCTNMGSFFLDILDNFGAIVQTFGVGLEAFLVGWVYLSHFTVDKIGALAHYTHCLSFSLGASLFGILINFNASIIGAVLGLGIALGGFVAAFFLCKKTDDHGNEFTISDRLYYLSIYNVEPLRNLINREGCAGANCWKVPMAFSVFIKYVIPYTIFFFTFSVITNSEKMYGRPVGYSSYPWYVFFTGQLLAFTIFAAMIAFFVLPDAMMFFLHPEFDSKARPIGEDLEPEVSRHPRFDAELATSAAKMEPESTVEKIHS